MGMLVGNVDLLEKNIQKQFVASGVSHILVVSGSNISLLLLVILGIVKYIPL
jgi:predicted membrane metal-binding protein